VIWGLDKQPAIGVTLPAYDILLFKINNYSNLAVIIT